MFLVHTTCCTHYLLFPQQQLLTSPTQILQHRQGNRQGGRKREILHQGEEELATATAERENRNQLRHGRRGPKEDEHSSKGKILRLNMQEYYTKVNMDLKRYLMIKVMIAANLLYKNFKSIQRPQILFKKQQYTFTHLYSFKTINIILTVHLAMLFYLATCSLRKFLKGIKYCFGLRSFFDN